MHGIHHVTAIAGNPNANLRFYVRGLGLRLVKNTVNFDDPETYHFYFGDQRGSPGTILTFFPWEHAAPGRNGIGLAETTAFRIPLRSIGYWIQRLVELGVTHEALGERFGEKVLAFRDPDGTSLALVGVAEAEEEEGWSGGGVPAEHAIRGLHGVTLMLDDAGPTGAILADILGFREIGRDARHVRFKAESPVGGIVDIRVAKGFLPGRLGRGSVHHVAFRAADEDEQARMVRKLVENDHLLTTEQKDRKYFRSVYFHEPGGVLFEIATEAPGFTVDEPLDRLGSSLKLPDFLDSRRQELESVLPPLEMPG
ncbi:ring-cleaving dioxygenase [Telmatospirillum sp. J64-1]|uniref:ring-cleaving dioxygenase n=1 Tax=Telmatospirillum sp. J64-1 TaxID=2502183 RepID=UPI00115C9AB8|nr:ring-cleaving dioxygenase [Telmatospirillum sp. J64-1]